MPELHIGTLGTPEGLSVIPQHRHACKPDQLIRKISPAATMNGDSSIQKTRRFSDLRNGFTEATATGGKFSHAIQTDLRFPA